MTKSKLSFRSAALRILRDRGPMHYKMLSLIHI